MSKISRKLKEAQVSKATQKGTLIPVEKLGQRLKDYREALGMTQAQLAKRLKVRQPVISRIEEDAASSSLKTIIKIAGVLECDFLGALVSRQSAEEKVRRQAERVAKKVISRTYASMAMEKQAPSRRAYTDQLSQLIEELSAKPGPELWEE
jgi:predicted DNA-binding mobile mystery protein A